MIDRSLTIVGVLRWCFMKRRVFRVAIAVLGLVICLVAFRLGLSSRTIPYCNVARNGEWFDNTSIRVRATLILGSDGMYVFEDCDPVEALASLVEFEDTSTGSGRNYINEVLLTGDKAQVRKVDAIIEGRFDAKFSLGCWGPKYHIAATKIELMSAITDYNPGPVGETPLRIRH